MCAIGHPYRALGLTNCLFWTFSDREQNGHIENILFLIRVLKKLRNSKKQSVKSFGGHPVFILDIRFLGGVPEGSPNSICDFVRVMSV
jgi:hypothetical protein